MTILMSRNFDYFLLEISNYDSSSFLKRLCGLKTHPLVFSPYFVPSEISGIRDQLLGAAQSSGSNESPAFISGAYQASACKSGRFGSNPVTPGLKIGALSAFIPAFSHSLNRCFMTAYFTEVPMGCYFSPKEKHWNFLPYSWLVSLTQWA